MDDGRCVGGDVVDDPDVFFLLFIPQLTMR